MVYLECPNAYEDLAEDHDLDYPSKNDLAKKARDIFVRMFQPDLPSPVTVDDEIVTGIPTKLSRKEELDAFLSAPERSNTLSLNKNATSQEVLQCLKKEMSVFEATGSRPA